MGKKILLPTDFSKNSWNAIQYAIKLYEDFDCDFYILNTYAKDAHGLGSYVLLDPDDAFNKMSENRSKEGLGDILKRLSQMDIGTDQRFHVISRSEGLLDAVKSVVGDLQIDMIVMGAKGMGNKNKGKYGSNTLELIESVRKCPALVVPENVRFGRPEEIVLATNFITDFKVSEIKYLVDIAKITGAHVQVLSLAEKKTMNAQQQRNKALLDKLLKDVEHSFSILSSSKMVTALSSFVEIRKSNIISYVDKKPSLWERLGFGKPTLGQLGYYSDVPVLALHG